MKVKRSLSCIVFLVLVQLITNAYSEDVGTQEVFESLQALGGDLTPSQNDIYSDTDSKIQDLISLKEKKVNEISGNEELEIATRDARESAMAIAIRAESEAKAAADRESQELTKRMVRESAERDALLLLERHTRESEQRDAQEAGMRKNPGSPDLEASRGSVQGSVEIYAQESADKPSKELAETEIPNELDEKEIRDSIAKDTRQSMMTAALEIPEKAAEKLAETEIMKSTNQAPGESDEEVVWKETQVVAEGEATKSTEEVATQSTDEVIGKLEEKEISVSVDMEGSESGVTDVNKFVSTDIEDTGVTLLGEVGSVMKELVEEELNIFREETATSSTSECANCETHEDEAMQEILEMQRREMIAQIEEVDNIMNDQSVADEAERLAKAQEANEALEAERLQIADAILKKTQAKSDDAWVLRSRPGAEAKPGAKLGQAASASAAATGVNRDSTEKTNRDRVPQSLRKDAKSGSKGSYFGSQSAADKESEAKRKEAQKKAKETDKISAGAGNRRREIEGKLSPHMRNKAAAAQQLKADEMMMLEFRRSRAAVARRFARPVEKVLSIYSSQSTDLYDVLNVGREVKEVALKKAYRRLALLVHPDKNFHPDSKMAFDAIQEAFETLSSPLKRDGYNTEQRKRKGRPSLRKIIRSLSGEIYNIWSRVQLFWVRVFRRGELLLEFNELIGDKVVMMMTAVMHTAEHIVLLPSIIDRVRLVSEMSYDSRSWLITAAFLAAII